MTAEELSQAIDEYFRNHLDSLYWNGLTAEVKSASITMAQADVLAELPPLTIDEIPAGSAAFRAIAEQAVFLARNYSERTEDRAVVNESVEGVSTTYRTVGNGGVLGHRAEVYIRAARGVMRSATVRFTRA